MNKRVLGRIALAAALSFPGSISLISPAADLPVRQIALYKHGVGYFERSGSVAAGDAARLEFRADQMNDVLKSLSITEGGTAKVSGVRFDSAIPLEEKLADFPFKIENGQALSAILDQLRGARVELQFGTDKAVGVIVGARALTPGTQPGAGPAREQITLLLDAGDLKTFDLAAAAGIRFSDAKLQAQFRDYLTAVSASRSADKRSVFIDSAGPASAHDITATYIVPSPVWKSSYRLLLGAPAPNILEGWAIVDNTTGEDWTGVRMSLISGKPISFVSALYEPKYIERLTADLPEDQAVKPVVYESALRAAPSAGLVAGSGGGLGGGRYQVNSGTNGVMGSIAGGIPSAAPPSPPAPMQQFAKLQRAPNVNYSSSISAEALAQDRGDLFEYTIPTPVTIRKNESAMLPFLQGKIDARRLLIYSENARSHPLQAAELKNTTGKTLDGGPITVFDAGAYAGEALVETIKAGDKRLISYAVDLGTTVTTAFDSKANITREIHMNRGVLTSKLAGTETKTFTASNVDPKAKTLIIEHPKRAGYELLSPKPSETTPTGYRFELALTANSSGKLAVSEERVFDDTTVISNLQTNQILTILQNKSLSAKGRQALNSVVAAKTKVSDLDRQILDISSQIESLNNDAKRTRDNIGTLNGVSGQQTQVQTYATQLATVESGISSASNTRKSLQTQRTQAQIALDTLIANLEF